MSETVENHTCASCTRRVATRECGLCQIDLCKRCVRFLDGDAFSFMKQIPPELTHSAYCEDCFSSTVEPALAELEADLARAQTVAIFTVNQRTHRLSYSASKERLSVKDCTDRKEALLRLAYFAVRSGHNSLMEVDVTSAKIRNGGYQTSLWQATGFAAQVDLAKLNREDAFGSISTPLLTR
jgi:hypothetical protein